MAYGTHFPANQVGGQQKLWDVRGYGLSEVWIKTSSTVHSRFTVPTALAGLLTQLPLQTTCVNLRKAVPSSCQPLASPILVNVW
jgi:hypothetical protein